MRRPTIPAALLALSLVAACATQSYSRRYVQAAETYAATTHSVADLVRAGTIKPDAGRDIQAALKVVRGELDKFADAIARGEERGNLEVVYSTVMSALREVALRIERAKQ